MKPLDFIEKAHEHYKQAIVRLPKEKIRWDEKSADDPSKRMEDFCVFILSYGRENAKNDTYRTLCGDNVKFDISYNQDTYLVCSDDDKRLQDYIDRYGDRVIVFNKEKMHPYIDKGDNFDFMKVTVYVRNMCFTLAKEMGYRYFLELDDDYHRFVQRIIYGDREKLVVHNIKDLDRLFKIHLDFLKNTPILSVTMSQAGDFIGGAGNTYAKQGWQRKVMNSFFCDVQRPFMFDGTFNDDVNFYIQAGRRGYLNFNLFGYTLNAGITQANEGGMTESYLTGGTYLKTFYSILYEPSTTKIGTICHHENKRIHHLVSGRKTYPLILDEKWSKYTYDELYPNKGEIDEF